MHIRILFFAILFALSTAYSGCARSVANNPDNNVDNISRILVETQKLVRQHISSTLSFSGVIKPFERVDIGFKTPGRIERLYFNEGDAVLKGDILAFLEMDEYKAAASQAEASYYQAKSLYERDKKLFRDGAISPNEIEEAETGYKISKATLELANIQLKNASLFAPISGKLAFCNIKEKETVIANKTYFTLMDISKVILEIGVPEYQISRLFPGQRATAVVKAFPGKEFIGEVYKVAVAIDDNNKLFKVEISLPNESELLKPGMIARVEIETERFENVYLVPLEAVIESNGERYIYLERDGFAVKKVIKNYYPHKADIILNEPLKDSERLIVKGHQLLKDGIKVYEE